MIKARVYDVIISPVFSEKATHASAFSKYTFKVKNEATKASVKDAVSKIYEVDVVGVNILNVKPKKRVFKGVKGSRPGYKKAIVTVKSGQTIDIATGA